MADISGKKFTVYFFWRLMERFGSQGISFVVSIILARLLAPEAYGTIALVMVFTTLLQVFVDGGLGNALIQKKQVDDVDYSSVFYFNILLGIVLYLSMFLLAPGIANFYNVPELVSVIRVLSLTVLISSIKNIQQAYVARNMLFKRFFWSTLGGTIVAAVIGIILAYRGYGVWALVALNVVNMLIDTTILWLTVKWRPKFIFSWDNLKELLSFGWKLLVARMVETAYTESRSLIIGKMYTSEDLAYFNRGKQYPIIVVTNIDYSITSVLFPVMASVQDNREKCKAIVRRAVTVNIFVIAPLMMGLSVCAEPVVRLMLTDKWLPCVPYLRVFCFTLAFLTFNTANMNTYRSSGRSDLYLKIEIIRKAMSVGVLLATMWFGVRWIAIGEIIATAISIVVTAIPNKKLIGYGFGDQIRDILPTLIMTLLMGALIYPIKYLHFSDAITLVIQVLFGMSIYLLGAYIMKLEAFMYIVTMLILNKKKGEKNESN